MIPDCREKMVPEGFGRDESVDDYYREIFYQALDRIITCILERFDQPGFRLYSKLQDLLLKCVNGVLMKKNSTLRQVSLLMIFALNN